MSKHLLSVTTILICLSLVASVLSACFMWNEYCVVKYSEGSAGYPFGSEEAIAVGGEHYRSKEAYSQRVLVDGSFFSGTTVLLLIGLFTRHRWVALLGTLLWVGFWFLAFLRII